MDKRLKIPKEWINIGDVNPERHGGIFVKWDRDMWEIVTTTHYADLPKDLAKGRHMFERGWLEPMEIFENPDNLTEGFTDWATKELQSFHKPPFEIESLNNPDEYIPDSVTIDEHINWILDNEAMWIVTNAAFAYEGYYGLRDMDFSEDYWSYLENYGIEKEKFE